MQNENHVLFTTHIKKPAKAYLDLDVHDNRNGEGRVVDNL